MANSHQHHLSNILRTPCHIYGGAMSSENFAPDKIANCGCSEQKQEQWKRFIPRPCLTALLNSTLSNHGLLNSTVKINQQRQVMF